ncbi:hypothetical protein QUF74_14835, partial [Candidatus Halobeggiatoa sp. HSG11]|nr:hypothetical protein [Candidatus Halobeggiatoa sp. HSG11]
DLIEREQVSPKERAVMIDEYGIEQIKQEIIDEATKDGIKKGIKEGLEKGIKEGVKEGFREGEENTKKELALNLLSMGMLTEEQIAQATSLSQEQVQILKEK